MDLDALSGVIAYKHTGDSVTTVTAAFDRITINHPLTEICDLELSGQVTYASGRSSMEISLQVAKARKPGEGIKKDDVMLTCQCTMVSLDPITKKPVNIPPVRTDTEEEKRLYQRGERNSRRRKELAKRSLLKTTPNDEESDIIHAMWQRQVKYHDPNVPHRKPDNIYFMDATKLSTASIMQPQYRNRHSFQIFGGFLLKQTVGLLLSCSYSYANLYHHSSSSLSAVPLVSRTAAHLLFHWIHRPSKIPCLWGAYFILLPRLFTPIRRLSQAKRPKQAQNRRKSTKAEPESKYESIPRYGTSNTAKQSLLDSSITLSPLTETSRSYLEHTQNS